MAMPYTSGVSVSGFSGMDFSALIDSMRSNKEFKLNTYQNKSDSYSTKLDALDVLMEKVRELKDITSDLGDMDKLMPTSATSSDSSSVSATATSKAKEGSATINVEQLASAGMVSNKKTLDSKDTVIGAAGDEFSYTYAGKTTTFSTEGMTAQDLVDKINKEDSGVKASLISTADGYVFQMQGSESGKENTLTVDNAGSVMSDDWHKKEAQDAVYTLDGMTDRKLTSSSNTLEGVIEGVTIDLKNVTDGEDVHIKVEKSSEDLYEKVEEYVDAVNEIKQLAKDLTKVGSSGYTVDLDPSNDSENKALGSVFTGNTTIQRFASELNKMISSSVTGFTSENNEFTHLGQIGVTTATYGENNGLLEIDEEKLKEAIENNAQGVANLLGGEETITNSENFVESSSLDTVKAGKYSVEYSTDNDGNVTNVKIDGKDATYDEKSGKYTLTDSSSGAYGMSIKFNGGLEANKTYTGESVSFTQGKADQLSQFFKEQTGSSGALTSMKDSYNDMIGNLDKSIAEETERLDSWEAKERLRYADLEALLGVMNAQMSANSSLLESMTSQLSKAYSYE